MHYVLSARDDAPYWRDNRAAASIPDKLAEQLQLWRYRSPWHQDAEAVDDLFPTASYQYILYGMGFRTVPGRAPGFGREQRQRKASGLFRENAARAQTLRQALPGNRELLAKVREFGFPKI